MTTHELRMQRVAAELTPAQAMARWLEEAETARSLGDYYQMVTAEPESSYPLIQLTRQVADATRASLRRTKYEEVQRAVRRQVIDVSFLYLLFEKLNDRVLEVRPTVWLRMGLLSEMLYPLLQGGLPRAGLIAEWRQRAAVQAVVVLGTERAVQLLGQQYFGGRVPLFNEVAEDLGKQVATTKELISLFKDARELFAPVMPLRRKRTAQVDVDPPVDLVALESSIHQYGEGLATYLVDIAKAAALVQVGDRDGAREYLARHLQGAEP